jgi:hypothetical protein
MSKSYSDSIDFNQLIKVYNVAQDQVTQQIQSLASNFQQVNAGQFIMLQFSMSQMTQIGESISNCVAMVNKAIGNAIQNQQTR